jgi:hypothetical protein
MEWIGNGIILRYCGSDKSCYPIFVRCSFLACCFMIQPGVRSLLQHKSSPFHFEKTIANHEAAFSWLRLHHKSGKKNSEG